jgi:hypothetical protein
MYVVVGVCVMYVQCIAMVEVTEQPGGAEQALRRFA